VVGVVVVGDAAVEDVVAGGAVVEGEAAVSLGVVVVERGAFNFGDGEACFPPNADVRRTPAVTPAMSNIKADMARSPVR
jgi:hypothetical protein